MNRYEIGCLLVLVFLMTTAIWIRPTLFGFDSYATWSGVKYGWFEILNHQPLANLIFDLLPDNLWVFKALMFLSIFATIIPIYLLVEYFYDKKSAWISIFLLLGLAPVILFSFGEFENEVFAYPLLVWAIYFFLTQKLFKSFLCWVSSFGFWLWPGYFFVYNNLLMPGPAIEQQRFAGVLNLWFLIPFLVCIVLLKPRFVKWAGLFAVGCWLFNAKLFILLLPFVALALIEGLNLLDAYEKKHENTLFNRKSVYLLAFFCMIGVNIAYLLQQPTANDLDLVKTSIKLSQDTNYPILNDWSFGYWLWAEGYKTKYNPGTGPPTDYNYTYQTIILSQYDFNCPIVKQYDFGFRKAFLYKCN